jgi:biotin transport system substrate-specific component
LWGYLLAAFLGGLLLALALPQNKEHGKAAQWIFITLAALLATVTAFACGVAGGMIIMRISFSRALAGYVLPFIPGNLIKLLLMVLLAKKFRPVIYNYTN